MSFEEIIELYNNMVFNLALNYTQNIEDAEEIAQDVFISVYQKISSYRADAEIKTWIYRIAVNKSLDFLKHRQRQKRWAVFTSFDLGGNAQPTSHVEFNHPGVLLEHKEGLEQLFGCINKLPDNQKTVVLLLKVEQLSQQEVAAILNCSSKAVESLFQRAKKNLTILLNQTKENG